MKYIYNIFAQFAWGLVPFIVAYTQSEDIYKIFEIQYSALILASACANSIFINLLVVRLYRQEKYNMSLSELILYLTGLIVLSSYLQSWKVFIVTILLVLKGLGYALLEYKVETKKIFIIEVTTSLFAASVLFLLMHRYDNIDLLIILIFIPNITYLYVLVRNLSITYELSWRSVKMYQFLSAGLEAIAITGINNFDRVVEENGNFQFYLDSRVGAAVFLIVASSIAITINIMRIRHGIENIKKYLILTIFVLVFLVLLSRVYLTHFNYMSSGISALIFTTCYYYIRQAFTDEQRLVVNCLFFVSAYMLYNFIGNEKDGYAVLLALSLLSLFTLNLFKHKYD